MVAAHRGGWSDILVLIGKVHEKERAAGVA
jgi:hypothetical protein